MILVWVAAGVAALFLLTVLLGAPYVPTHARTVEDIFELARLGPGQLLLELGAGDGRVLKRAGELGIHALGYEINPVLWLVTYLRIRPYRKYVRVQLKNYKMARWPENTGAVYIFGSDREMRLIAKKLGQFNHPVRLVSYGFKLAGSKPLAVKNGLVAYKIGGNNK